MTMFKEWFRKLFEAISPNQEGNAWDEYKRYRAMDDAKAK